MRILRRYLVICALMFWLGGFTFYASIVVPVGTRLLGAEQQGFITRDVTRNLNITGVIALVPLAWDIVATRNSTQLRRWSGVFFWLIMAFCQLALFRLHAQLDSMLDLEASVVLDPAAFRPMHRVYLWVQTVQWTAGLFLLALMVWGWQQEDGTWETQRSSANKE
jgi:hypothetical protein